MYQTLKLKSAQVLQHGETEAGKFEKIYMCNKSGKRCGWKKYASLKMTKSLSVDGHRQKGGSPCLCLVGGAAALHACSAMADALKSAILPACSLMVIYSRLDSFNLVSPT